MRERFLDIWLGSYLRGLLPRMRRWRLRGNPTHVLFRIVDHFEPVACGRASRRRSRSPRGPGRSSPTERRP